MNERERITSHDDAEDRVTAAADHAANLPNTTSNPPQGAAPAWAAEDARRRDFDLLQPGWNVISADGEQMGAVVEKGEAWFSLHYGTNDERTMFIPGGARGSKLSGQPLSQNASVSARMDALISEGSGLARAAGHPELEHRPDVPPGSGSRPVPGRG
jgi:hypothetical protein